MKKNSAVLLAVFLLLPIMLFAIPGKIVSISYLPANPNYGDMVRITVQVCEQSFGDARLAIAISTQAAKQTAGAGGQVFVVDANGVDRRDVSFNNGGTDLGFHLSNNGGAAPAGQCKDCGGADGWLDTYTYDVHIPTADYFSGVCNPSSLYIIAVMDDYSFNVGDWSNIAACSNGDFLSAQIPIIVPPPSNTLTQRYEGTLTAAGDEVLYSMDYSYGGSGAFSISDTVPGGGDFTVLAYGPTNVPGGSVTGPAIGQTSGNYVWNFPSRAAVTGMQSGTVWMLLKLNNYTLNKVYTNTATTTQPGTTGNVSSASITSGAPAISVSKTESVASLLAGGNLTYVLSYDINGYVLQNFQPFDNVAEGTYNSGTGAPAGWKYLPYNGDPGTWTIHDPCSTGGTYITGSSAATEYPGLLLDDGAADPTNQFCTGMIISDFYIEDSSYSGADAQVIVRSNGLTGTAARIIGVIASIDDNPAVLFVSVCGGSSPAPFCAQKGPAGSYSDMPQIGLISAKKWYRMRILFTADGSGGQIIQAKIWARGDPEPGAWDINYDIPNVGSASDWACDGSGTYNDWRPGVNQQTGDGSAVQDSYDNFTVYAPRSTAAGTKIYDTVPTGLTYGGNPGGGCTQAGGVVNCNIGAASLTSGSFTWYGTANTCNSTLSNQALIEYSAGSPPIASNRVEADVLCWSPTCTVTNTLITGSMTFTPTETPTFTVTPTDTCTWTATQTFTAAGTLTNTPAMTPSETGTLPTSTVTVTDTWTATLTVLTTATYTPTLTMSSTPGGPPTSTATPTMTYCCSTASFDLQVSGLNDSCSDDRMSFNFRIYLNSGVLLFNNNPLTVRMWIYSAFTPSLTITSAFIQPGNTAISTMFSIAAIPDCFDAPDRDANMSIDIVPIFTLFGSGQYIDVTGFISGANPFDAACDDYSRFGVSSMGSSRYVCLYDQIGLVAEQVSPGVPDPLTGVPPCSIPSFTATQGMPLTATCTGTLTPVFTNTGTLTFTSTLTPGSTATPTATPAQIPAGTPSFSVSAEYGPEGSDFITIVITSLQILTGPAGVTVYVNGADTVFYYTATQSPANPLVYTFQYPKQAGLGDIARIVVTGTDAAGTAVSDGTFVRQPNGDGNVWMFRNVFNPDNGERAGAVFRHGTGDKIRVRIFNKRAAFIKELASETTGPAGLQQVYWDGTNDKGVKVVSGIYIMLVETSAYKITEKIGVVH